MKFHSVFTAFICVLFLQANVGSCGNFSTYYSPLWGLDHISVNPQGTEVQLKFDNISGGAGFRSKLQYGSGWFHIKMKLPLNKSGAVVPNFYLTSQPDSVPTRNHYELDFEFIGSSRLIHTNVFDNDGGNREQTFNLWFDPSQDFHSYDILWNYRQIVFFVDNFPIRVFKNNSAQGIGYISLAMQIEASIWHADFAGPVDWSHSPFVAHYKDFDFGGCPAEGSNINACSSPLYYWNKPKYLELNAKQKREMYVFRKKYMQYDYCSSPKTRKPECAYN